MKLGLQAPVITSPQSQEQLGDLFGLIAQRAERAGLSSLWVMDHFFRDYFKRENGTNLLKRNTCNLLRIDSQTITKERAS